MTKNLMTIALLTAGIVLLTQTSSEAQRRRGQRGGQRGAFGGGFGGGGAAGAFRYLAENKYAQEVLELSSKQKETIASVSIQLEGTRALTRDNVKEALKLSETQVTKIEEARRESFQSMRGLFGRGRGRGGEDGERPSREDIRKRFEEAREKADEAVLAVLTTQQKSTFEKMKGKKIDIEKLNERPEGAGGRRGRGGNRPQQRPDV